MINDLEQTTLINRSESLKLKSLYIEEFKNLINFNIDFSLNNLTMLIGNNGSGKSNILEAISSVFTEIYVKKSKTFAFTLIYEISGKEIKIVKKSINANLKYYANGLEVTKNHLQINDLFPSKIVSIYSGEENRLWNNYYKKSYDLWLKNIYSNKPNDMIYINRNYWNIALFALMLSDDEDDKNYIEEELGIKAFEKAIFQFNVEKIKNSKDKRLNKFITKVNETNRTEISMLLNEDIIEDYKLNWSAKEIFELLINASIAKNNKLIKNIELKFKVRNCDKVLSLEDLSEGQNKKLLLRSIFKFLAFENSILLLDEPDAHLHELAKNDLYAYLEDYTENHYRQIIITTHSPMMTHLANNESIKMLETINGSTRITDNREKDLVAELTGGLWSAIEQNIFKNSITPLILVEGKGDIEYLQYSMNLFSKTKCDFLFFGGASCAAPFIRKLLSYVIKDKPIILLFDRDTEGANGLRSCIGRGTAGGINDKNIYKHDNVHYLLLPKTKEHDVENTEFLIEDYFSIKCKRQLAFEYAKTQILNKKQTFNSYNFPKLHEKLKADLADKIKNKASIECFSGFKTLVDKIESILSGNEQFIEIENILDREP